MHVNKLIVCLLNYLISNLLANVCHRFNGHLLTHGRIVDGNTFHEGETKDIIECAQFCVRKKRCKSFNYDKENRLCQWNSQLGTQSTLDQNFVHSDISGWPSQIDQECFSRPCGEDGTCFPGQMTDDPTRTYSCLKLDEPSCSVDADCKHIQGICYDHTCRCKKDSAYNKDKLTCYKACEDDWLWFDGHCYFFGTGKQNHSMSKDTCDGKGSHLVQIDNEEENLFLKRTLATHDRYWIDLYQIGQNGQERWLTTNDSLTFSDWAKREPDSNNEQCTVFIPYSGWHDILCARDNNSAMCEKMAMGTIEKR